MTRTKPKKHTAPIPEAELLDLGAELLDLEEVERAESKDHLVRPVKNREAPSEVALRTFRTEFRKRVAASAN